MRTIVIGLALTATFAMAFLIIAIAVLRAGIRRQERAACFTCHPPGLSAAIARRVLGLHTRTPSHNCGQANSEPASSPNGNCAFSARKEPV
jgi:hypothetical protein